MPEEENVEKENIEVESTEEGVEENIEGAKENIETNEDVFQEAHQETMDEIKEMQDKKEEQAQEKETKPAKPKAKKTFDLEQLNTFKDKLIKDFGLEEKTNERKRTSLKYNGKNVIRLIPRKRVWYAVKRYDHGMKRIMYYTIESEKDEEEHYKFVKFFIKNLSEKQEAPKEEA